MFYVTKSYGRNVRVFVNSEDPKLCDAMKNACVWGGHDKSEVVEGILYFGYEFRSLTRAMQILIETGEYI